MNSAYKIAGHQFNFSGVQLCNAVEAIEGFAPFRIDEGEE